MGSGISINLNRKIEEIKCSDCGFKKCRNDFIPDYCTGCNLFFCGNCLKNKINFKPLSIIGQVKLCKRCTIYQNYDRQNLIFELGIWRFNQNLAEKTKLFYEDFCLIKHRLKRFENIKSTLKNDNFDDDYFDDDYDEKYKYMSDEDYEDDEDLDKREE